MDGRRMDRQTVERYENIMSLARLDGVIKHCNLMLDHLPIKVSTLTLLRLMAQPIGPFCAHH